MISTPRQQLNYKKITFVRSILAGILCAMLANNGSADKPNNLRLNGCAIYEDLGKQQFVAALFTETQQHNANSIQLAESPKRMEVRLLNNYSKRRWLNLWMQSISINNDRESFSGSAQEVIDIMQAPKSAPQKGDVIEYLFGPDRGTSVRFNGTELVSNYPNNVFNILLRTWIGPIPPSTAFKDQLLGNSRDSQALSLLQSVKPQPNRVALAASWMAPPPVEEKPLEKVDIPPLQTTALAAIEALPTPDIPEPTLETVAELASETSSESSSETLQEELLASEDIESEDNVLDFDVTEALAQRDYTPLVVGQIYKSISYPRRAVDKNQQGTVRIAVSIDLSGELVDASITQKSDFKLLNKAALKAVKDAAPFPPMPTEMKTEIFELSLPITFRLQ